MAKVRQTTSCLKNCLILSSYSLVSRLRALSQPTPRGYGLIFHVLTRGKQDGDREKMEVFPTWGEESLTSSIGISNPEVHAESMQRHRDGMIGLSNTGPSPFCSIKSPELLTYTSGASEQPLWVTTAEGSRGLDGHWRG